MRDEKKLTNEDQTMEPLSLHKANQAASPWNVRRPVSQVESYFWGHT